ncbi:uncharacterized protein LOC125552663 isoform X1 [Triticum urartu]|uniref:uncharacterized protein LOC125552663 isoform X1 n=1 Tax=Triticum urartu TaxID=4572 RepID=UPI0020447E06|nr:uncharacterized protein LOC125552663 isoform X1 [Triticum urartu]
MDAAGKRPEVRGGRAQKRPEVQSDAGERSEVQGRVRGRDLIYFFGGAEEVLSNLFSEKLRIDLQRKDMPLEMLRNLISEMLAATLLIDVGEEVLQRWPSNPLRRYFFLSSRMGEKMTRKQVLIEIEALRIIARSRGMRLSMDHVLKEAEATVEMEEQALKEIQTTASETVEEQALKMIQAVRERVQDELKKSSLKKKVQDELKKSSLKKKPRRRKGKNKLPEEALSEPNAYDLHRNFWNSMFAGPRYGCYETTTSIPPMRFTDDVCDLAGPLETLQIFSVKVVGVKKGISWPLSLYGKIAARDTVDRNRNIIFDCERDNCEILYEDSPYLPLTGPSRAVVLSVHHSYIEVELKLKLDSGDEEFSYVSDAYIEIVPFNSFVMQRDLAGRLSTLQITVAHIIHSVEATISVKVKHGEWPYGHGGLFTASTASINDMEVVLLGFEVDEVLPVKDDGHVKLFRRVVSVESKGKLEVLVEANPANDEEDVVSDDIYFTPKRSGRSHQMLKVGSCEMEVTVAWSLLLSYG